MLELIELFIGTMITTLSGIVFIKYILKEPIKTKKIYIILIIIVNTLLTELFCVFDIKSSKFVIGVVLNFILFKVTFKMDNIKAFLTIIILYLFLFTGEILFFSISTNLLKISGNSAYYQFGGTIFGNFCISLTAILIGYLLRNFLRKFINIKVKTSFLVYWGWACFCILILLIAIVIDSELNMTTCLILGTATMILLTVFFSIRQSYQHHELASKYDKLLEFIKKYEIEIDNQRILRHETKNQFVIIKSKIIDKDKESNIINYINEIIEENNNKINNSEYAKLGYLPSNGIKGLFYFKVSEAIEHNIHVDININKQVENSFLNDLNSTTFNQLGKVIGIFLDNAIESAEVSSNKQLGIEIYCHNNEATFIISNTYKVLNNNGQRSTKGPNRGHGLLLAKQIIKLNPNFINETIITNTIYTQKLKIKIDC